MIQGIKMITKQFEVTFDCEISQSEVEWLLEGFDDDQHAVLSKSHRILLVDGFEDIYALIQELADNEFIHDVALIKEVITYEPQYDEQQFAIDLEGWDDTNNS